MLIQLRFNSLMTDKNEDIKNIVDKTLIFPILVLEYFIILTQTSHKFIQSVAIPHKTLFTKRLIYPVSP